MSKNRARLGWLLFVGVVGCTSGQTGVEPLAIDPTGFALAAPPRWANANADFGRLADEPVAHLTVTLARPTERQRAFDVLREQQDTPGSPAYHHWLTPTEIGEQFGASSFDIAVVTGWLEARGLTVLHVANSRTFIEVEGTTRTAESAFGVELHHYQVGNHVLRAPDRAPTIPAAIARLVTGVTGLTETISVPQHHTAKAPHTLPQGLDGAGDHFLFISDFATIYDLAPAYADGLEGSGQVVGIIGRSRVFAPDITNFGSVQNATLAPFTTIIPPDGVDPGSACGSASCDGSSSIDDQLEATLDVGRVTSIARSAKVELIASATGQNGDDGVFIALNFAIDQFGSGADANLLTASFGLCESLEGSANTMAIDTLYQDAAAQGQTIFVSAGDAGAAGCDLDNQTPPASQSLGVNALCTSSASTCVGGTEFADTADPTTYWSGDGSALSYIPEGVWNEPFGDDVLGSGSPVALGGGGGISAVIGVPSYQSGLGSAGNVFRLVPDVSMTAACHDFYFICFSAFDGPCTLGSDGSFSGQFACGTSASAPSLAAIMAVVFSKAGTLQGAANPGFYSLGAQPANHVFNDVTVASSGVGTCDAATPSLCNNSDPSSTGLTGGQPGFAAQTGYDEATGWGSVDVGVLAATWGTELTQTVSLSPDTLSIAAGGSGTTDVTTTGFAAPTFACSGLPETAQCQFDTTGSGTTLTITTVGPNIVPAAGAVDGRDRRTGLLLTGLALAALWLSRAVRRQRRWLRAVALRLAVVAVGASCGNSAPHDTVDAPRGGDAAPAIDAPHEHDARPIDARPIDARMIDAVPDAFTTPTGHYTVVVTATSGTATASANLTLTITN